MQFRSSVLFLCCLLGQVDLIAGGRDRSVMVSATVQVTPPAISLSWSGYMNVTGYQVWRKLKGASTWGTPVISLGATDTVWTDLTVAVNTSYEYKVVRSTANLGSGYGYVNAGIELDLVDARGTVIVIVDSTMAVSLVPQLAQAMGDLEAEGWKVIRHDVPRTAQPSAVKALAAAEHALDPSGVKALWLIGHVPVPYSGALSPDGHSEHYGAWSADSYYGDLDGAWTDATVSVNNNDDRNDNFPGDERFDQTVIPSPVELQVGRVDFANLSIPAGSEAELLAAYLDKLHEWKVKAFTALPRALVDDNFQGLNEGFSATGYRGFAPLVGAANVTDQDYVSAMSAGSYLFSYGCGGGGYTSCSGVVTSEQFAANDLQGVFTLMFGSYFGDFDSPDNLMRSSLASGRILANGWSGQPMWFPHHMAMGETIGYTAAVAMNNDGHYAHANGNTRRVHIALLGDPTLRMAMVAPPSDLQTSVVNADTVLLGWSASPEAIVGYHVFRSNNGGAWERRTASPVTETSFVDDVSSAGGVMRYRVRAMKLEVSPSGSYYNLSLGAMDEVQLVNEVPDCAGVFGGEAYLDSCGVCAGGSTGVAPNTDGDGDLVVDCFDNCPTMANTDQTDMDEDGVGDVCDGIGILERSGAQMLTVFPNPTGSTLYIAGLPTSAAWLEVIDGRGLQVDRMPAHSSMDVFVLPTGPYVVLIRAFDGHIVAGARFARE